MTTISYKKPKICILYQDINIIVLSLEVLKAIYRNKVGWLKVKQEIQMAIWATKTI